ncbi:hypothetical protein [Serratia fonticola]
MPSTTIVDSVETLNAALLWHVPDMQHGFTICTYHGEITIRAEDAQPFAAALESLLLQKIRQVQQGVSK